MNFTPASNIARTMRIFNEPELVRPRPSFAVHRALSARLGRTVVLGDRLTTYLLAHADLEPTVKSYSLSSPTWRYVNAKGVEKTTTAALTVDGRTGKSYWDCGWGAPSRANEVKALRAAAEGTKYRYFEHADLEGNAIALSNRLTAQKLLYDGFDVDTREWETAALLALSKPRSIAELGSFLDLSVTPTTFVALRLWLRGLVAVPLDVELLGATWLVGRI